MGPSQSDALARSMNAYRTLRGIRNTSFAVDVATTSLFICTNTFFFLAGLFPALRSKRASRIIEIAILVAIAMELAVFLVDKLLSPKLKARVVEGIDEHERSLLDGEGSEPEQKSQLPQRLSKMRAICSTASLNKFDKVALSIRGGVLLASLALEVLLVVDLFHDFGLATGHGKFVANIEDTTEFFLTALILLCVLLECHSYYLKTEKSRKEEEVLGKQGPENASKVAWINRGANCLVLNLILVSLTLVARVFRGLEGTSTVAIGVGDGVFCLGYLLSVLLCFAEICKLASVCPSVPCIKDVEGDVRPLSIPSEFILP